MKYLRELDKWAARMKAQYRRISGRIVSKENTPTILNAITLNLPKFDSSSTFTSDKTMKSKATAARKLLAWLGAAVLGTLLGCSGQNEPDYAQLTGQVGGTGGADSKVSHYAASRFLEHVSMGPSPSAVAQVRAQGIESWIDRQQKLAPSIIRTPYDVANFQLNVKVDEARARSHYKSQLHNLFVGGEDQLGIRTSWILSNFLVVSDRKVQTYGASEYFNMLQTHAFGQYGDLLKAVTRNPAMGFYLDNASSHRLSLNENYGRELMQLFSVGLVQLNMDGTPKRDANGKVLETYSQKDVIEITRALTGWKYAEPDQKRASSNFANYDKPMEANWTGWDPHDTEPKTLLGKNIPGGQDAMKDLDSLVDILISHPNTAPFVSLRLIQGMTTSDPSPAYLQRVATVFAKTRGHLGQVIHAILTDPEARAGDDPLKTHKGFGRIKEPHLLHTSIVRALGCRLAIKNPSDPTQVAEANSQQPLSAFSVFSFYPPNHRAPGSKLLAPEQKMLNSAEFSRRMGHYNYALSDARTLSDAGCDTATFEAAARKSYEHLAALLSERLFRGAMPAAVAQGLVEAHRDFYHQNNMMMLTGAMIEMAMLTPSFGVSK